MRSEYADYFNHDDAADGYDVEVTHEEHPIRTGYRATVSWVGSRVRPGTSVLDLGSGTGNTIAAIDATCRFTAVDISTKMTEIAKEKLSGRTVDYVNGDILDYMEKTSISSFDFIVSTYALHHLTPEERKHLFATFRQNSAPGAVIVVGDLMYRNPADKARIIRKFEASHPELALDFEDEYFWDVDETTHMLETLEYRVNWRDFSDLSWAAEICAK